MFTGKIAYIISRFPVLTETFILREIEEVKRRGIEVEIFSLHNVNLNEQMHYGARELALSTWYIPFFLSFRVWGAVFFYLKTQPLCIFRILMKITRTHLKNPILLLKTLVIFPKALTMARILKDMKISRIHAHWATVPTTVAWIIYKLNSLGYTFTAHAWDIFKVSTMLEDKIQAADKVITCTNFNKKYLLDKFPNIDSDKIVVVYHGLDFSRFNPCSRKKESIFTILSIARLDKVKGIHHLLEACHLLRESKIPFLCHIIYVDGDFKKEILHLYHDLGLEDHVQFIPQMSQEELIEYYKNADCFVLPCIITEDGNRDGIPNVIIEALAMELPVVTTSVSGIPEVVQDGQSGLLVQPGNVKEIASAIERLYRDRELRVYLGQAKRQMVYHKFEISTNVDRLLRHIL